MVTYCMCTSSTRRYMDEERLRARLADISKKATGWPITA